MFNYTKNGAPLSRITTAGQPLPDAGQPFSFQGNRLDAHGGTVWITDFNSDVIWRYDISADTFTSFAPPTPGSNPGDIVVAANGIVWFT